ncbi:MAG: fibronectin type III domain-containing protein [Spirochaetes bacterium]|nr:fibronectin type III domain-containing protein [Spirochaetota bacterium]
MSKVCCWPFFIITLSLAITIAGLRDLRSEYVFLKDGKIIPGSVVGDTAAGIVVRQKNGTTATIPRNTISRVAYTNLYLGRLYVRLTDGSDFLGFLVDEDSDTYTFRKSLESPDEFRVDRQDVLFSTRRNPTHLKGSAGEDSVELKWHAPYNRVSNYNIYRKGPEDRDFALVETSGDVEEELSGLMSRTAYTFYVTAVYGDGEESLPSNIINVTTKNFLPDTPGRFRASITKGHAGKMDVGLSWKVSVDPDGTVSHYNVYLKSGIGTKLQGKTLQTSYELSRLDTAEEYDVIVRAVDNTGTESEEALLTIDRGRVKEPPPKPYVSLSLYGSFLMPLHDNGFKKIAGNGFGILASAECRNLFLPRLSAGLEAGYLRFSGKKIDMTNTTERHVIAPLCGMVRYDIRVYDQFFVVPEAGGGMGWNTSYSCEYSQLRGCVSRMDSGLLPLVTGGLALSYRGLLRFSVTAGARYYRIFDPVSPVDFMMFYAGTGYSF